LKLIFLLSLDFTIETNTMAMLEVTQGFNTQNVALLEILDRDFLSWIELSYVTHLSR
jgi:hypothetical protein